jgi:aspartate carbamoyltransferase catalytic subunit
MKKQLGSVVNTQQFLRKEIETIFETAENIERDPQAYATVLCGKVLVSLFYEPSTRTRLSFETAMVRLGGGVVSTENALEFSSAAKGETLEDTVRIVGGYGDALVLRYHREGGAERAAQFAGIPVINAGDGPGQHPTQALLDAYTIRKQFGKLEGLTIALVGDLANGRTVRSLCYLLAKHFPNNEIVFVSPEAVSMREDIKDYLTKKKVRWSEATDWDEVIGRADVVYQTRVQKERFTDNPELLESVKRSAERLVITPEIAQQMKPEAIILHPLPRVGEITFLVDADPRAKYFEQARNGLYVRMALLLMMLEGY